MKTHSLSLSRQLVRLSRLSHNNRTRLGLHACCTAAFSKSADFWTYFFSCTGSTYRRQVHNRRAHGVSTALRGEVTGASRSCVGTFVSCVQPNKGGSAGPQVYQRARFHRGTSFFTSRPTPRGYRVCFDRRAAAARREKDFFLCLLSDSREERPSLRP